MFTHAALGPKHFQNVIEGRSSGLIAGGNGILFRGKKKTKPFFSFSLMLCTPHTIGAERGLSLRIRAEDLIPRI